MRNITVLGDGAWGTALALVLQRRGTRVTVWSPFLEQAERIAQTGENARFLPGVRLPATIRWSADPVEAVRGAHIVVLAIPSRFFRSALNTFRKLIPKTVCLINVSKGFDPETRQILSNTALEILGPHPVAALSGPSHAEEVALGLPCAVTLAAEPARLRRQLQSVFATSRFRVYTSPDLPGIQLGGALKNVVAVAAGVCDGLAYGDNAKAALISRGLAEMTRFGCRLGACPETFAGLSGMGDLIVTCMSRHSRNRAVGERIGRGERVADILRNMEQAAEGIWNCSVVCALAKGLRIEVPIARQVHAITHENVAPATAVETLLSRDLKPETPMA